MTLNTSFLWKRLFFVLTTNHGSFFFLLLILISACSNFPLFLNPGGKPLTCYFSCVPPQLTLIQNLSSAQTCTIVVRVPPSRSYFKLTTRCHLDILLDLWADFQIIPMVYMRGACFCLLKKKQKQQMSLYTTTPWFSCLCVNVIVTWHGGGLWLYF